MTRVKVLDSDCDQGRGRVLARRLKLQFTDNDEQQHEDSQSAVGADRFYLQYRPDGLNLVVVSGRKSVSFCVDFDAPAFRHRARTGLESQPLIKALGIKNGRFPTVIDGTAGFAKDAYLMARAGCEVLMTERSLIVSALLTDGLSRSRAASPARQSMIGDDQRQHLGSLSRMTLVSEDFLHTRLKGADVVYLDPMFPHKKKSAQVKKDMYVLQRFFATNETEYSAATEENEMIERALELARRRVVVKRPRNAPSLAAANANLKPSFQYVGKTNRYDVYLRA